MIQAEEIVPHLKAHPIFSKVGADRLAKVAEACRLTQFRAGRRVLKKGDPADAVFVLISGGVAIVRPGPNDTDLVVKLFKAPAFFGEADVLLEIDWLESVRTVAPSEIIRMPADVFRQLVALEHEVCRALVFDLSRRLLMASEQERAIAFGSAEQRIATYLVDHMKLFGVKQDGEVVIDVKLSQNAIADALAVSRKTVGRALQQWTADGILRKDKAKFVASAPERLEALAIRRFGS